MQCYGCLHFVRETTEYGNTQPPECRRMEPIMSDMEDGRGAEQISIVLEQLLFKLSELNNCPFFDSGKRRSILDLK